MPPRSDRWPDYFVPDAAGLTNNELKKHRTLVFVCFLTSALAASYLVISLVIDFPTGLATMAVSAVVIGLLPFALKKGAKRSLVANLYVTIVFVDAVVITTQSGGLSASITSPYLAIVPMLGLMLINTKAGFTWFFIVVAAILALGIAELSGVEFPTTFDQEVDAAFKLTAFIGLVVIVFFIVRDFDTRAE